MHPKWLPAFRRQRSAPVVGVKNVLVEVRKGEKDLFQYYRKGKNSGHDCAMCLSMSFFRRYRGAGKRRVARRDAAVGDDFVTRERADRSVAHRCCGR